LPDEGKEAISTAAAVGYKALTNLKVHEMYVTGFSNAESSAESVTLAI
jgi:hypothetical protein